MLRATLPWLLLLALGPLVGRSAAQEGGRERYLVACPRGLVQAVDPLLEHRRAEGLEVELVVTDDLGATPEAVQAGLRAEVRRRRPAYLLLVGDVDRIPAFTVAEAATDRPYGDLDDDGLHDLSVGRFPTSDRAEVAVMAQRTVAYERARDGGRWRKQCAVVAGEGRFGPVIDAMIERLFLQLVSGAIPPGYDVDVTYASPDSSFCYPPRHFSRRVLERLDEGALVYAYVGHGQVQSLDRLTVAGQGSFDILGVRNLGDLAGGDRPPVFVSIACYTGSYQGPRRSIGEALVTSGRGPVAFFGSTEVSHPIHNALLATALIRELFAGDEALRLGPALDRARASLVGRGGDDPVRAQILGLAAPFVPADEIERESPRHVDMYNLLGDPALRLARPEARVELDVEPEATAGEVMEVAGRVTLPVASVTLSLEVERGKTAREAAPGETAVERYARANDPVVRAVVVPVGPDGRFEAELALPPGLPGGRYLLKAFAGSDDACAIGAAAVDVWGPSLDEPAARAPLQDRARFR